MPRLRYLLGLGTIGLTLTGCVPAEQYAGMKLKADQLAEQLAHSQTEIAAANARADASDKQLQASNGSHSASDALASNEAEQIKLLQSQNDEMNRRLTDAMNTVGKAGTIALPTALNSQLSEFASQNPDLIDYDPTRGIVKFKSDVTFAVGDTTVTAKGKEVLKRFSTILNSGGADQYELLVAGNTDSTPVTSKSVIARGNFDNWYLSAHRAISVSQQLIADGVSSSRMGVVGYADKRPVASNSTEAGKAMNRRVEVLILPTSVRSAAPMTPSETAPTPRKPRTSPTPPPMRMNKDAGPAPTPAPVMNK